MKTMIGLLLLLWLSASHPGRYQVALVGFYNLENLYDTVDNPMVNDDEFTPRGIRRYTAAIFRDKLDKLARVISTMGQEWVNTGPAILGVAEIENDTVLQFLIQHPLLRDRGYHLVHADSKDRRGVDVALLFQPAFFTPLKAEKIKVTLPPIRSQAALTRDILYVSGLFDADTIHVFVNHWPSRRGGSSRSAPARMMAAQTLQRKITEIHTASPGAPVIVMGDFNDDPTDPSITEGLQSVATRAETRAGKLYNPWTEMYLSGMGTLAHGNSRALFDQILWSDYWLDSTAGHFYYYRARIHQLPFMVEDRGRFRGYPMRSWNGTRYRGGYSDHFPVYVVLLKKADAAF
ncbi:MAG: endonuclease/exonuclease/phosphatase [Chitinophagaceae bacterium]|jgi:exonuclease III|nr:endonuclease/exonuclease/phosphatase [Chitinophagaceae bacterium]